MLIKKNNSSILLYVLLMLSLITVLTLQLTKNVWIDYKFDERMMLTQQAKQLAFNGLSLACTQLIVKPVDKKNLKANEKPEEVSLKNFLYTVLPNLNKWQTFNLTEKIDYIDAEIKFCISCENGKINLNSAFDFEKNEFKKEYINLFKGLSLKGKIKEGEFLSKLTDFFKSRRKKLEDISQLSKIKEFEGVDIFYNPPEIPVDKKNYKPNENIFLQDLFTIQTDSDKIELLFSSDSLLAIFGLNRPLANDSEKLKDKYKNLIEKFKKDFFSNLEKKWEILSPIYGQKSPLLSTLNELLSKEFVPKVYSVISCGKIKGVEQKVLAYVSETENKKEFKIVKIYWL